MENIKKAIKHFECMKSDAVTVLDSGFGTKPNESNTVYKNRKLYAELAISALDKQIPKHIEEQTEKDREFIDYVCPNCKTTLQQKMKGATRTTIYKYKHCIFCGQALDWSDTE